MKIKKELQATNFLLLNNRGFAIVETIAALAILSFVLVGMMIMVQYARVRAVANYHDRFVLLKTDGELQRIKYRNHLYGDFGNLGVVEFEIPQLNKQGFTPKIPVKIYFNVDYEHELAVGTDIGFNKVTAIAEWNEHMPFFAKRPIRAEKRYIQLREDYYIRRTTP